MTVYWLLSQLRAWAHAWSGGVAEMEARMGPPLRGSPSPTLIYLPLRPNAQPALTEAGSSLWCHSSTRLRQHLVVC